MPESATTACKKDRHSHGSGCRERSQAYYVGRFLERADGVARSMAYTLETAEATKPLLPKQTPRALLAPMLHDRGAFDHYLEKNAELDQDGTFQLLALDESQPSSIASCLRRALANATGETAFLPADALDPLRLFVESPSVHAINPISFLGHARTILNAVFGAVDGGMRRGETFDCFWLGVSLERADTTLKIMAAKRISPRSDCPDLQNQVDREQWHAVTRALSASESIPEDCENDETARAKHVLTTLILDDCFPRSVRYCVSRADEFLRTSAQTGNRTSIDPATQSLGRLRAELDFTGTPEILSYGIFDYLDIVRERLVQIHESISTQRFGEGCN